MENPFASNIELTPQRKSFKKNRGGWSSKSSTKKGKSMVIKRLISYVNLHIFRRNVEKVRKRIHQVSSYLNHV